MKQTEPYVSQRAREAAAKWAKLNNRHQQAANIKRGSCDDAPIVQAFARFETDIRAERDALREALKSAAENLSWAARMMKGNCRGSDVDAVNLAAGHATEAAAALDRKESGNG